MDFSSPTRAWFDQAFAGPTEAQRLGWASIGRGDHTLILAPTGSGKTLAAFLLAIDRLITGPPSDGCRVLYVSPLKALSYDVARNLTSPLEGIAREAARMGIPRPEVRVATRTGDTPADARRQQARRPPDILVTTPESLYLLLTSKAAEMLRTVEHVIVDEIHAVAATKRGAHLALSLERLEEITIGSPQRIGLSATQRPLDELARFLGGRDRPVTIVDVGTRKPMELRIVVAAEDQPDATWPASIWPAVYPRLLELIRQHRSTLIFVNSRRLAERLAAHLNELGAANDENATQEVVRAHHGSLAREQRTEIEDALKDGRLPALVATSSLELGIDMGAIDLVIQVEAPTSVASGLQRIGRAGHQVGEPSKGRIFPKFRHDLLVAAAVAERMQAGLVEATQVPRNPLDVLAQQLVAAVVAADGPVPVDSLAAMVRRAYPYSDLSDEAFEGVLDMLAGRYPSDEFAELRPRLVWDRAAGTVEARPGARMLAVVSGGTIPDRGLYGVFTPEGARVGELDEEMVYESRVGETFLLGATTWRIQEITRDRVIVVPAPGAPGKMPFWHGDSPGRPFELGTAIGSFTRTVAQRSDEDLGARCGLDPSGVRNLRAYLTEEIEATGGLLPSDEQIVVERFRDAVGDWRLAVLSPFGARVHAPWALAIEARLREERGVESQALWSDDGIIVRLPETDEPPRADVVLIGADRVQDLVVAALGGSALFAARFRENAARALLLPRRRPGSRTPLWQLRLRAADLLQVASRHGSFPILLETYRECMQDVFDLPGLARLLSDIAADRVRVSDVEVADPSPFASGLVFAYVAQFMYEGDAPLAERRAQALTLDRRMLAELLGTDELRDLLDPDVMDDLEAELQGTHPDRRASSVEAVADLLRRVGDLSLAELAARCRPPDLAGRAWAELTTAGRAVAVQVAGELRLIAVEDASRYWDGLGVTLPDGLPAPFLASFDGELLQLVRRWARTHGPFIAAQPARRLGADLGSVEAVLDVLGRDQRLVRGAFRPGGVGGEEWCDVEVLRTLRQRSLAALRKEVEPVGGDALVRFLPVWHGIAASGAQQRGGGTGRLLDALAQLEGFPLAVSTIEADILPARVRGYEARLLDELLMAGEVMWVGAGALSRGDGRVVLIRRDRAGLVLPRWGHAGSESLELQSKVHAHIRSVLAQRGACFFREMGGSGVADGELLEALWDLVWAGEVTSDGFAALRASTGRGSGARSGRHGGSRGSVPLGRASRPRPGSVRLAPPPRAQGRWSLVRRELAGPTGGLPGDPDTAAATRRAAEAAVLQAEALLARHGVLTGDAVRAEGIPGGYAGLYPVLKTMEESGRTRRGHFLAGMGGAQFAAPGAVDLLRSASRGAWKGRGAEVHILAASDPANPYGLALPWPVKGPARSPGAYVISVDGVGSAFVERGGRGLVSLRPPDGSWEEATVVALSDMVTGGRWKRLVLQRYPDELAGALRTAGFVPSPKGLVRYP